MTFFKSTQKPTKKLDMASQLAEAFTKKQCPIVLDELENALLIDGVITWNRDIADKFIGQRIALAYAMGALDRTENKSIKKLHI